MEKLSKLRSFDRH